MRLLIPFPAGGSTEFTALTLAGPIGRALGEPVVVEARVGDAGIVALRELARATAPTLMVGSVNTNSIAPVVFADRIDFDYDTGVRPVTRLVEFPSVAVTRRAVPADTLTAFVAHARRQWGRIRNGTDWIGSYPDIDAARLGRAAGIEVVNLARDGGALALLDALVAGEVDLLFLNVRTAGMGIDAGTIRPLAVTGPRRLDRWPGVPTMAESGFPGIGTTHWHGLFASAGVAPDTLRALHRTSGEALRVPAVRAAFHDAGARLTPSPSPEEFAANLRAEMTQWRATLGEIGLDRRVRDRPCRSDVHGGDPR
jgi:tripartite-type tricarboxylate transporter receptor subunit TctC